MKGGFGILAFILSIVAIPIPVLGVGIGWLALLFAAVAAWQGERVLPVGVVVLSLVSYTFLSPTLWLSAFTPVDYNLIEITIGMILLPVVVLIARPFVRF